MANPLNVDPTTAREFWTRVLADAVAYPTATTVKVTLRGGTEVVGSVMWDAPDDDR